MIRDYHHTVLLVSDMDRSIEFYCDTLGLELINRDDDRRGEFLDQMFNVEGVHIKLALLRAGGEIVELVEPVAPAELVEYDGSDNPFGIARIGWEVEEIEELVEGLKAKGVEFLGDIVEMTVGHYAGGKVVFFRDPDGIVLEFQQPAVPGRIT
ncbi:MAG: VOC family protein [Actinobacteria bacterium]|nr:VOC family protein [Actinomycetota bacterium]